MTTGSDPSSVFQRKHSDFVRQKSVCIGDPDVLGVLKVREDHWPLAGAALPLEALL